MKKLVTELISDRKPTEGRWQGTRLYANELTGEYCVTLVNLEMVDCLPYFTNDYNAACKLLAARSLGNGSQK